MKKFLKKLEKKMDDFLGTTKDSDAITKTPEYEIIDEAKMEGTEVPFSVKPKSPIQSSEIQKNNLDTMSIRSSKSDGEDSNKDIYDEKVTINTEQSSPEEQLFSVLKNLIEKVIDIKEIGGESIVENLEYCPKLGLNQTAFRYFFGNEASARATNSYLSKSLFNNYFITKFSKIKATLPEDLMIKYEIYNSDNVKENVKIHPHASVWYWKYDIKQASATPELVIYSALQDRVLIGRDLSDKNYSLIQIEESAFSRNKHFLLKIMKNGKISLEYAGKAENARYNFAKGKSLSVDEPLLLNSGDDIVLGESYNKPLFRFKIFLNPDIYSFDSTEVIEKNEKDYPPVVEEDLEISIPNDEQIELSTNTDDDILDPVEKKGTDILVFKEPATAYRNLIVKLFLDEEFIGERKYQLSGERVIIGRDVNEADESKYTAPKQYIKIDFGEEHKMSIESISREQLYIKHDQQQNTLLGKNIGSNKMIVKNETSAVELDRKDLMILKPEKAIIEGFSKKIDKNIVVEFVFEIPEKESK